MKNALIPFERYAGLNPVFLEFLRRHEVVSPDPPTVEAALARGRSILGRRSRIPASAFRSRGAAAGKMAEELAGGRAVAVITGQQVGLFTGPLLTFLKACDAMRVAREIRARGVPAVPVFYALTDDHDLEEIARTARPNAEGPEILVLEGADRANRRPVGELPIPDQIHNLVEAFRNDAKSEQAGENLDALARRYAPGTTYGEAFSEALLDLAGDEPLLVIDPMGPEARAAAAELFRSAAQWREAIETTIDAADERLRAANLPIPVSRKPGVFPFFLVEDGQRRRVENVEDALQRIASGAAWASADVLTRPLLKSFLVPAAASILGPGEMAYHAQSVPLFPLFEIPTPVLLPRSHVVWTGPAERRALAGLGLEPADLLSDPAGSPAAQIPEAARVEEIAREADTRLASLDAALKQIDPTLAGALETTRRKIAYQLAQLEERMTKAMERKDQTAARRRRQLATVIRPEGAAADRLYPPLVPLLAFGPEGLAAIARAARGSLEGVVVVDLAGTPEGASEPVHAG